MEQHILKYETTDEAYDLLQNGILVETNKGLVCMSLNDALSSNLNLSVEELKDVANKLILQQNVTPNVKDKVYLKTTTLNFDSDGFSSECSDVSSVTSAPILHPTFIAFTSLSNEIHATLKKEASVSGESDSKFISFLPCTIDGKNFTTQDISTLNKNEVISLEPSSGVSDSDTSISTNKSATVKIVADNEGANNQNAVIPILEVHKPPKRRGGWPKGRKRKPELLNLPPKAPATGYNLYLNEQRKLFKDSAMVFHEITKVIGNKWSNLSLDAKRPYLARAEEDKRRYREELKQYRQSDAYQAYLTKKRRNRLQNNVLSESDMDATDEIDDEDNEELYCRTCDQWFHNLHNKREHLQGRQHTQSVAGDIKRELDTDIAASSSTSLNVSLDESSLDAIPNSSKAAGGAKNQTSVADCMLNLVSAVSKREKEIKSLQRRLQETSLTQDALCQQLNTLRQRQNKLKNDLLDLKEKERTMEMKVSNLWQVPSWFVITNLNTDPFSHSAEGTE